MAWTAAQLAALKNAVATGATEVTQEGRTVKYRSIKEMIQIIQMMESESSGTQPPRSTLVRFDRGY